MQQKLKFRRMTEVEVTVETPEALTEKQAAQWSNWDAGGDWLTLVQRENPTTTVHLGEWEPVEADPPFAVPIRPRARRRTRIA